jgi:hypothetical protein
LRAKPGCPPWRPDGERREEQAGRREAPVKVVAALRANVNEAVPASSV